MFGDFAFELVGTCTRDVDYTTLRSGQRRAAISLAVNKPYKNKETGELEEKTTWVRVAVFGDRAESTNISRCKRGMPVYVRGTVESYAEEFSGRTYTMYNFRPDIIRPLLSVDALAAVGRLRGRPERTDMPDNGGRDEHSFED